jgi:RHH-type proline utilization regulon transcriptional repressor/proline dehydrogenase/delta 1-pyrroline-5-carboxylate dehydrogenase
MSSVHLQTSQPAPSSNPRIRELGLDLFERARAAQPGVWEKAYWLEQATQFVDRDPALKTRAFQFVECLPALHDDASIARHVREYLDPRYVALPKLFHAFTGPGPMQASREALLAAVARMGAGMMAGRFIAGSDAAGALKTIERLRRSGMTFTLDVLGESTTSEARAEEYLRANLELITRIAPVVNRWPRIPLLDGSAAAPMPRMNLSVKLTSLDPHFDPIDPAGSMQRVARRVRELFRVARQHDAFINIDMEAFRYRDLTFDFFESIVMEDEFRDWPHVGIVVQAYLVDADRDLARMLDLAHRRGTRFAIRLVKGAYWDAEVAAAVRAYKKPPVWTQKWESDACYERLAAVMLGHTELIRPAFASHNVRTLAFIMATAESLRLSPLEYELQNLFGMGDPLKTAVVEMGRCMRVYLPCGAQMPGMAYLIRRLLENTSNDGFLKQAFGDRASHASLLADPAVARPRSATLPARRYQNTDPEEEMSSFTNASNTNFALADNREKLAGAIRYVRGEFGREYPLVINHAPVVTGEWHDSVNPADPREVVGRVAMAGAADADAAVAAAMKAFDAWRHTPAAERADALRRVAGRMEMRRLELAATMILECGKPWREADADVTEAVDHLRYYADQIERIEARPRRRDLPGESNLMIYSPKGVCAVISPWAFPTAIPIGMAGAALAAGNTVVFKPARQAAVAAAKLMEIFQDAGLPPGVINFLPGKGGVVGRQLVEHGDVRIVAFTGSQDVGFPVLQSGATVRRGQSYIKKMIVEMGGKNAIIVDDDADIDGAVSAVAESAFMHAGQKCSSCSRVIVLAGVHDEFVARLSAAAAALPIGPAEAPATWIGPVIDEAARDRINDYAQIGRSEGRLAFEGKLPAACATGWYCPPRIFVDVKRDARMAREEIFGPLLCVLRAETFAQAIDIANDSPYALTGGVFSRSPAHIEAARQELAVGNLYINRRITGSQVDAQPFGGFKLSGTGVKAGSPDYLLHFMDARCITENTLRSGLVADDHGAKAAARAERH